MRRLLTALAVVAALLVPGGQAIADDGDYPPGYPSSCNIDVPHVAVGQRVHLVIEVASNSNVPEVGTVKLTISTASARRAARAARGVVWTKTVRYEGTPLDVVGPVLPRGRYRVAMAFTPDDAQLSGCRNAVAFRVGGGGTGGEDDDGGSLPNTGGPHLWIMLAGLGLVVAGGGLAGGARRARVLA